MVRNYKTTKDITVAKLKEMPNKLVTMVEKTRLISRDKGLDAPVFMKPSKYIEMRLVGWQYHRLMPILLTHLSNTKDKKPEFMYERYSTNKVQYDRYLVFVFRVYDEDFTPLELSILGETKLVMIVPGTPGMLNWVHDTLFWDTIKSLKIREEFNKIDDTDILKKAGMLENIERLCGVIKVDNKDVLISDCPIASSVFNMPVGRTMIKNYTFIKRILASHLINKPFMNRCCTFVKDTDIIEHPMNFLMSIED